MTDSPSPRKTLETDYLVVGAGAAAMSFVDSLLSETDKQFLIVDRHDHPGGHWNDAYSFIRLHQPSAYYGVCSRELGSNRKENDGWNKGIYELATRDQILDYYGQVMRQRFLPSGRVHWLPLHDLSFGPDGKYLIRSLLSGEETEVIVKKKFVNSTHARTEVPSTHSPRYSCALGVELVTPNQLTSVRCAHSNYTVIGSGKTGMDVCLWLLENGIVPDRIRWIMPRDAWLLDRQRSQPCVENFDSTMQYLLDQLQTIIDASSIPHLFKLLESRGVLMRLDANVEPEVYHCATILKLELEQLRRI